MRVNINPLVLEQINPRLALFKRYLTLGVAAIANIIKVNHLADFAEAEPHILRPQNPRQPRAIPLGVDPREAFADWRNQPLILIKTQSPRGDFELF